MDDQHEVIDREVTDHEVIDREVGIARAAKQRNASKRRNDIQHAV